MNFVSRAREEVDICVECFGKGIEFGRHLRKHSYRVIPPLNFPVFSSNWRADEEIQLLEAIESMGLGNWRDVSEQIGNKSFEECQNHFHDVYLDWNGAPMPVIIDYKLIIALILESCQIFTKRFIAPA